MPSGRWSGDRRRQSAQAVDARTHHGLRIGSPGPSPPSARRWRRLRYVRGPEGIIVALAEQLS